MRGELRSTDDHLRRQVQAVATAKLEANDHPEKRLAISQCHVMKLGTATMEDLHEDVMATNNNNYDKTR